MADAERTVLKKDSCSIAVDDADVAKWEKAGFDKTGDKVPVPASKTTFAPDPKPAAKPKKKKNA